MAILIGILIATTDRFVTTDLRVISRVNVALHFVLSSSDRQQIWTDGVLASGSQKCLTKDDYDIISNISELEIDGHGITNIIQSAARIARSEQEDIYLEDVERLAELHERFSYSVKDSSYSNIREIEEMELRRQTDTGLSNSLRRLPVYDRSEHGTSDSDTREKN